VPGGGEAAAASTQRVMAAAHACPGKNSKTVSITSDRKLLFDAARISPPLVVLAPMEWLYDVLLIDFLPFFGGCYYGHENLFDASMNSNPLPGRVSHLSSLF
jgi:hypothetical protein